MENSLSLFLDHFSREEIKLGTSSWSDWGYGMSDLPQNLILYADSGGGAVFIKRRKIKNIFCKLLQQMCYKYTCKPSLI